MIPRRDLVNVRAMADLDEAAARDIILAAASGTTTVVRAPAVPSPLQPGRLTVMMLALPLAAGAALIVHMVTDRSLAAALGLAIALAVGVTVPTARRLPRAARAAAARRARIGVLAGLVGLAASRPSR